MRNKVTGFKVASNGYNYGDSKELIHAWSVLGVVDGCIRELVTARTYMGRSKTAMVVYAAVWAHGKDFYTAGRGSAGGGGYHKSSAAIAIAIRSAGVQLAESISGVGDQAIDDALIAIAEYLKRHDPAIPLRVIHH